MVSEWKFIRAFSTSWYFRMSEHGAEFAERSCCHFHWSGPDRPQNRWRFLSSLQPRRVGAESTIYPFSLSCIHPLQCPSRRSAVNCIGRRQRVSSMVGQCSRYGSPEISFLMIRNNDISSRALLGSDRLTSTVRFLDTRRFRKNPVSYRLLPVAR